NDRLMSARASRFGVCVPGWLLRNPSQSLQSSMLMSSTLGESDAAVRRISCAEPYVRDVPDESSPPPAGAPPGALAVLAVLPRLDGRGPILAAVRRGRRRRLTWRSPSVWSIAPTGENPQEPAIRRGGGMAVYPADSSTVLRRRSRVVVPQGGLMPYVMVPVPEEHVQDVMQFILREMAKASLVPWDEESVTVLFHEIDEANRSLLAYVARATLSGTDITEPQ